MLDVDVLCRNDTPQILTPIIVASCRQPNPISFRPNYSTELSLTLSFGTAAKTSEHNLDIARMAECAHFCARSRDGINGNPLFQFDTKVSRTAVIRPWHTSVSTLQWIIWEVVNDRYRYWVSDIGDISKFEDIGLSVFAADPICNMHFITCVMCQLIIQASCRYAKFTVHGMQNCGERL